MSTTDDRHIGDERAMEKAARQGPPGPRYPNVTVQLSGEDGNAFFITGRTQSAMRRAGVPDADVARYYEEATSGDYDNVIRTTMEWVTVR